MSEELRLMLNDVIGERDACAEALEKVLTVCRECRDEAPPFAKDIPPAEFILWGKLLKPEALGPKCYDHAAKHIGHAALSRTDMLACVDLRPIRHLLGKLAR